MTEAMSPEAAQIGPDYATDESEVQTVPETLEANGLEVVEDELDELPVRFEVSLSPTHIPLSKIRALNEGSTVDLGVDFEGLVHIQTNGKSVGVGRLVQIGDHVGVEIAQWKLKRNDAR